MWDDRLLMAPDAFHPDLRSVARWLPRASVSRRSLPVSRALQRLGSLKPAKDVEVELIGRMNVRLYGHRSHGDPLPALLWIHGGGYVLGSAAQDDAVCRHLARRVGMVVASVEYRLAPEYRYPVPLNDCHDALVWLAQQPYVDPTRIAIGGASAGGGLAAALALLSRERGAVQPAFQLLAYPMIDDRTATRTDIDETNLEVVEQQGQFVRLAVLPRVINRGRAKPTGWPHPPVARTCPGCPRHGSGSAHWICSTKRTLPTPIDSIRWVSNVTFG